MRQGHYRCCSRKAQISSLEPAAAVSQPPGDVSDWKSRAQSPPDRQNKIGGEPEHSEREPENLALHTLDCKSFPGLTIRVSSLGKTSVCCRDGVCLSPETRQAASLRERESLLRGIDSRGNLASADFSCDGCRSQWHSAVPGDGQLSGLGCGTSDREMGSYTAGVDIVPFHFAGDFQVFDPLQFVECEVG